jgi:hypothetical protein
MNVIDSFFQPLQDLCVSVRVDFQIFYCVFLVNDASVISENFELAVSSRRLGLDFIFSGRSGDGIQVTGFSVWDHDAYNSCLL